jgi:hypothetical protein
MNGLFAFQISSFIILNILFGFSTMVMSEEAQYEICFSLTIVTKQQDNLSEVAQFKQQKYLIQEQLSKAEAVFDKNIERNCPKIIFKQENIKHITWEKALRLSQPLDQGLNEKNSDYQARKTKEHLNEIKRIATVIKQTTDIKYFALLELSPGATIVNAKRALAVIDAEQQKFEDNTRSHELEKLRVETQASIKIASEKLDSYGIEDKGVIVKRAEAMRTKYQKTDDASANNWQEGVLILWNDVEAQDTSVELKNLLHHYHTQGNNCLDVYVVPKGKSPSRTKGEIKHYGDWTTRGGAAFSKRYFPRTTEGRGHTIILTQNTRKSESRLSHELGHLLIDKPDAHFGKEAKDLMHENSLGGTYLDEEECNKIKENITSF